MARIRSIHPGLFTDEAFVSLSCDAQILFLGLWTEADDQGVFEWKPTTLRMRLRPTKDGQVEPFLGELETVNNIRRFESGGRHYGAIRNFRRFQRPKKPNSIHPLPDEIRIYVALSDESSELEDVEDRLSVEITAQMKEEGGMVKEEGGRRKEEGGMKDSSGVAPRQPPDDSPIFVAIPTNRFETQGEKFVVTERFIEQFQGLYPAVDVRAELRAACAWCVANKDLRKTLKGMSRFLNGWLSRQQNKGVSHGTANRPHQQPAKPTDGSFGSGVSRAVHARRSGGGLFDSGSQQVIGPDESDDPGPDPREVH